MKLFIEGEYNAHTYVCMDTHTYVCIFSENKLRWINSLCIPGLYSMCICMYVHTYVCILEVCTVCA